MNLSPRLKLQAYICKNSPTYNVIWCTPWLLGGRAQATASNLESAMDHSESVHRDILTQASTGSMHGPFVAAPLPNFCCSLIGPITHKQSPGSQCQRIHHLSWPKGSSVNDGIPNSKAYISYDSLNAAIMDVQKSSKDPSWPNSF